MSDVANKFFLWGGIGVLLTQLTRRAIFAAAVAEFGAHCVNQVLRDNLEREVGCLPLITDALILLLLLSACIITCRIHVRRLRVQARTRDPTK